MSYKAWFTTQDVIGHRLATRLIPGGDVVKKDVVFFNFQGQSLVKDSPGIELCEPATEKHFKDYPREYAEFLASEAPQVIELETLSTENLEAQPEASTEHLEEAVSPEV